MEVADEGERSKISEPNDKQMYSALSFCIMLVLVGIPLWWKTTEVYRVSLPYSEIDALPNLEIQIQMNIHVVTVNDARSNFVINELRSFFKMSKLYKVNLKQQFVDKVLIGSCKTLEEIEKKIKHPHFDGSLQLFEVPGLRRFTSDSIVLGQHRTVYFSSDTGPVKLFDFLKSTILKEDFLLDIITQANSSGKAEMTLNHIIPPADDFDVLFTVLNPDPDVLDVRFDVNEAIKEYITPFLRNLEDMNKFYVKSQWLYFVPLQVQPKFLNSTERVPHFALSEDLLPHVITPLEKKLASHVSKHPCLNFVLFISPCSIAPLKIYTTKGFYIEGASAFISSRWGGIQIHNPDRKSCLVNNKTVVEPDKHNVMSVFIKQFRLLLGISEPGLSEGKSTMGFDAYLSIWEKDSILRMRTVQQLTTAKLTIQSLSKLLGKISNIVINDQVGEAIYSALENTYGATEALANGKLAVGYKKSKSAFLSSERAFTDPSLLALLYFPDDQKYAVYIPLFLPIMIPILISFKHIKQWAKQKFSHLNKYKKD